MVNRIMLNETSYHGAGAVQEIATEVKARGFRKALVCTGPDLMKFGVTAKVTDVLDAAGFPYEIFSDIKANPTIENDRHRRRFIDGYMQGYRYHHKQPGIRGRQEPGGRCAYEKAVRSYHSCADNGRNSC